MSTDEIKVGDTVGVGFNLVGTAIELTETCVVVQYQMGSDNPFLVTKQQWLDRVAKDEEFRNHMSGTMRKNS